MFKFRIDHPYRPVNWRWERARVLIEYGDRAPGQYKDDRYTRAASTFKQLKDNCRNELELYTLFDKHSDIAMAYELWDEDAQLTGTGKPNAMRYEIEARLLARESLEMIAAKAQLSVDTIDWYEKLYFNVLDRIDNRMYILHQAIGDSIHRGMSDRDYAIIWKLYAYVRGSAMLDFLIHTFSDWNKASAAGVSESLYQDHKTTMRRKSAMAARMIGVNGHTQDRLIELYTKIVEVESSAVGGGNSEEYNHNIQLMLSQLPLLVGTQTDSKLNALNINNLNVGLRADELLALSAGQQVDTQSLTEIKFPELPSHGTQAN